MAAFDAVGALAAEPGGRELGELLARVQRIDPEVLLGMGRGLAAMADGVQGSLRALGRHGDDVRRAWQGRGADALTGYLDEFGRAGTRTLDTEARIRARVDAAGQELAGLRHEVDAQVSRALDAARAARAEALADPARAPMADQLAAAAMAEPTAATRAALARAETSLGDAATALRQVVAEASAFSRLATPDARPIASVGADRSGWIPAESGFGRGIATVPAAESGGQGIDLAGGDDSGDFTDTSSLDGSSSGSGSDPRVPTRARVRTRVRTRPARRPGTAATRAAAPGATPGVEMLRIPEHQGRVTAVQRAGTRRARTRRVET
ncbi:hypothetical protein Acsp06_22140 [Actinomycetospora sp. NBRC 106375]|uniref:WXG100 family type VII secretion target n=1 Tax=Actinomycetospora sp. NBRC 106375 TaxID=3032207 RepID=UPI0024A5E91B|nr:WXG100 family type VII secretion target [Actinomycetospora sp. NBRC 106375]GLZ46029.1 hypothetical protein Acsp06_22140 [Actinomycetospora sp. NBRC 106375]